MGWTNPMTAVHAAIYDAAEFNTNVRDNLNYLKSNIQVFMVNAFQYPAPGTDWTPAITGAGLIADKANKKCWLPLNFLKINDQIVSYKLVGNTIKTTALTLDCKLVTIDKGDPVTTEDVAGGGIVQITADGIFDAEATLNANETVATDTQYALEIEATTAGTDTIVVMGAEVTVVRVN